jgi:hypothetical protein
MERPGNGYGRPTRPRPPAEWRDLQTLAELRVWDPVKLLAEANDATTAASGDAAVIL